MRIISPVKTTVAQPKGAPGSPLPVSEEPSERDLFLPLPPEPPEPLSWWLRRGEPIFIGGYMIAATAATVGASFADGGLTGTALGLVTGAFLGSSVGFFASDLLVHKLSQGKPSDLAFYGGRAAGMGAGLWAGLALGAQRLPDDVVIGPGVPALFIAMFESIDLSMDIFYRAKSAQHDKTRQYETDLEAYQKALEDLQRQELDIELDEDYIEVGDIPLKRD